MGDKIKTLSQAIRLGATFRPQGKECLYNRMNNTTCALGAAIEATGGLVDGFFTSSTAYSDLKKRFNCSDHLCGEIAIRNDSGSTREQIADWLESQGL